MVASPAASREIVSSPAGNGDGSPLIGSVGTHRVSTGSIGNHRGSSAASGMHGGFVRGIGTIGSEPGSQAHATFVSPGLDPCLSLPGPPLCCPVNLCATIAAYALSSGWSMRPWESVPVAGAGRRTPRIAWTIRKTSSSQRVDARLTSRGRTGPPAPAVDPLPGSAVDRSPEPAVDPSPKVPPVDPSPESAVDPSPESRGRPIARVPRSTHRQSPAVDPSPRAR
jgi:hypothetical protein